MAGHTTTKEPPDAVCAAETTLCYPRPATPPPHPYRPKIKSVGVMRVFIYVYLVFRWLQVKEADIVVCAAGRAEMVKADWIKPGAAVIDVGINSLDDPTSKKG